MNEPGRKAEQKETSSGGRRLEDLRGLFVHSSLSEERLFAGMVIFSAWILLICPMFIDGWTKATKPKPQISRSIHNSGSCQARVLRQAVAAAAIVVVGRHN